MLTHFSGYKQLKGVKLKYRYDASNPQRFANLFKDCNALTAGSIKVPKAAYHQFITAEALNKMAVPGANEAEKRAKFVGLAELNP